MALHDRTQDIIAAAASHAMTAFACALALTCLLTAATGRAEERSAVAPVPPAAQPSAPSSRPGFLDTVGRWFDGSKAAIDSGIKSTQETIGSFGGRAVDAAKDAAGAARDAAGNLAAIPGTRIVNGRQVCPLATNGAPDCQVGVDVLCRKKGFQGSGKVLDIATSQRCSARTWVASGFKKDAACRTETFVTRGVCQ